MPLLCETTGEFLRRAFRGQTKKRMQLDNLRRVQQGSEPCCKLWTAEQDLTRPGASAQGHEEKDGSIFGSHGVRPAKNFCLKRVTNFDPCACGHRARSGQAGTAAGSKGCFSVYCTVQCIAVGSDILSGGESCQQNGSVGETQTLNPQTQHNKGALHSS